MKSLLLNYRFHYSGVTMQVSKNVPPVIACSRITLSRPQLQDAQEVYEAVAESTSALREFPSSQPWALAEPSLESSLAFCKTASENHEKGTDFPFLIWVMPHGEKRTLIGCCGLHKPLWKVPSFELGYWVRESMMRKGFASEAVCGLIRTARNELGAQRVSALIDSRNLPSQRVAQKCGMTLEGKLRNYWIEPDRTHAAALVYSVIPVDPVDAATCGSP